MTTDKSMNAFDAWLDARGVWPRLTYVEIWEASRRQALEESADHAEEWSNHVIEDNAPMNLRKHMENLK